MKNNFFTFKVKIICTFIIAGFFLFGLAPVMAAEEVGIKTMKKGLLGTFLTDGRGITLYTFSRDKKDVSNCVEGCAVNWPPFHVDPAAVIEGCESSGFTTITRTDGRQQTTFKGKPLYYFKNDKYPGDTFGQGIGDVWFVVLLNKPGNTP